MGPPVLSTPCRSLVSPVMPPLRFFAPGMTGTKDGTRRQRRDTGTQARFVNRCQDALWRQAARPSVLSSW